MSEEARDVNNEAFFINLKNIFAEAKEALLEGCEKFRVDPTPISDEEFEEIRNRQDEFLTKQELTQLTETYWRTAGSVLERSSRWLPNSLADEDLQNDALAAIYWYQHFIAAKIHRAFHSCLDVDGFADMTEPDDGQSDANGSAKLALIATERSIRAWSNLLAPGTEEEVCPLIELLEKIKLLTEKQFPKAYEFVRPGFDEVETVM